MSGLLTSAEVLERLRQACREAGSQRAFAAKHGISDGHVSEILSGKRALTDGVLRHLGLRQHQRLYAPLWPPEDRYDPTVLSREAEKEKA